MAQIHGVCDDRFGAVREALADSLDGDDVGASAAVFVDGEAVVDIWGGYADEARTRPWERDTITNVWSTTKTMTALCALMLADRGELDLHAPVARYWPEFAAAGKGRVEVAHLLAHTAGLPSWDEPLATEDLYDWEKATSALARQAPRWEPGTESGYHALTQGYLVGEVIRRVTGVTVGTFFAEQVAGPLGADFHIGLAPEHDDRVSPVIPPPAPDAGPALDAARALEREFAHPPFVPENARSLAWRRAEVPAAGGQGNARSVAAVQSVLACGGEARGVRLLSEAGCAAVLEEQSNGKDRYLGVPIRFGMGYALAGAWMPNPRTCFWGGWGGSVVMVDLDARMCVAYVMNRMLSPGALGDDRGLAILLAAYEPLEG
ncbi:serine hydrolase domain-containing protein [Actinomadura rubrisoli]|uniref:Class A beta-lactamase-related serine hydrolase n=1 Tax=Actinomadura rubrisoli TaxID=2530368 RepID=A0A4R4ZWW7_9ACTN|nr:serine hydrolase domain-containing protein [Actinomadura rubrisoli]TDD63798.1 class A beta-lactamase-related serine hydrolase [Actinomadura rubrisoli]